jgi:hypothetical protein
MRIDENTVAQARAADMVAFFEKYHGFTFAHRYGEYRCEQHKSLAVKSDRLSWYWHSKGVGGHGVIDYLTKIENMPFRQAVEVVTGTTPTPPPTARPRQQAEPPKVLVLPEKTGVPIRLYDYLCNKRSIDGDIVNTLIQEKKLYEDKQGNVVFVGHDEQGKPRFASKRGTHGDYRGDCPGSDKRYSFNVPNGTSPCLFIYESPIDLMSHASLEEITNGKRGIWKRHSRLSLSGTSDTALPFFLNRHKTVKELILCLDNDTAGREAAAQIAQKYALKGYTVFNDPPRGKDHSEDLQALTTQIRAENRTNSRQKGMEI